MPMSNLYLIYFHVTNTRGNLYSVTKCSFRTYSLYEPVCYPLRALRTPPPPPPPMILIQLPSPHLPWAPAPSCPRHPFATQSRPLQTFPTWQRSSPHNPSMPSDRRLHWSCYYCVPQDPLSILCRPDQSMHGASGPLPTLYPPTPSNNPVPAIYLSQTTPPTIAHWGFSTRRTQLHLSYDTTLPHPHPHPHPRTNPFQCLNL